MRRGVSDARIRQFRSESPLNGAREFFIQNVFFVFANNAIDNCHPSQCATDIYAPLGPD